MIASAKPHLLFVVGSTATGKSDLAVEIAERVGAGHAADSGSVACAYAGTAAGASAGASARGPEIINSDSVAFFDQVDIGAAKPSRELLARVKHHLVGHVRAPDKYTAGDFRRDALKILAEGPPDGRYLVVGGSGFYSQALEKGMYDVADPDPELKARIAREAAHDGFAKLYDELKRRDPDTKIQPADHYRIGRALEILRTHPEKTMSEIRAEFEASRPEQPFTSAKIGLVRPRDVLRQKVTDRTRKMLTAGLIDEVEALRRQNLHQWSPMQSVGYKEVQAFLDGQLIREDLEPMIVQSTMQLAKQQNTWFKRDPRTEWFDPDTQWDAAVARGAALLAANPPRD